MQKNILLFLFTIFIVFIISVCDKRSEYTIVAKWRDIEIKDSEFARSYFDFWSTTHEPDSPTLRRKYARHLIEQRLIVKNNPLIDLSQIEKNVARDHASFLRRRYLEKIVGKKIIPPTDQEVKEALVMRQKRLYLRQIWSTDEKLIRSLMAEIDAGASFEDVALKAAVSGTDNCGSGTLGWIGWGDTDLPVEHELFSMHEGQVSRPIQSLMGWHIFRLDSVKTNLRFGTISAIEEKQTRQQLFDRRFDMAVAEHLRHLIWQKSLKVNVKILADIWRVLEPQLPSFKQRLAITPPLGTWWELPRPEFATQVVAQVDGEDFTVAEFFAALPDLPANLLRPNLKKALEIAIRDKILTQQAIKCGLQRDEVVREKTQHSQMLYSYYAILAAAKDSSLSPPLLHQRLLPKDYRPEDIIYRDEVMQRALLSNTIID